MWRCSAAFSANHLQEEWEAKLEQAEEEGREKLKMIRQGNAYRPGRRRSMANNLATKRNELLERHQAEAERFEVAITAEYWKQANKLRERLQVKMLAKKKRLIAAAHEELSEEGARLRAAREALLEQQKPMSFFTPEVQQKVHTSMHLVSLLGYARTSLPTASPEAKLSPPLGGGTRNESSSCGRKQTLISCQAPGRLRLQQLSRDYSSCRPRHRVPYPTSLSVQVVRRIGRAWRDQARARAAQRLAEEVAQEQPEADAGSEVDEDLPPLRRLPTAVLDKRLGILL